MSKIPELTFLEESLLKQAEEEAHMKEKDNYVESEVERIAELRRKGRGKGKLCSCMFLLDYELTRYYMFLEMTATYCDVR